MSAPEPDLIKYAQPFHVTLSRSAKGKYYWEISVHREDRDAVNADVAAMDADLRERFKGQLAGEESA